MTMEVRVQVVVVPCELKKVLSNLNVKQIMQAGTIFGFCNALYIQWWYGDVERYSIIHSLSSTRDEGKEEEGVPIIITNRWVCDLKGSPF